MENDRCKADFLITVDYTDVAGYGDGVGEAILSVPAGAVVSLVGAVLETPFGFTDEEVVGATVELGDGGLADRYREAIEVGAAGAYVSKFLGMSEAGYAYTEADTVDVMFRVVPAEATTPDLSTCTSGKLHLYLSYHDLSLTASS